MMNRKSIVRKQNKIVKRILESPPEPLSRKRVPSYRKFLSYTREEVQKTLGATGVLLYDFLSEIDLKKPHPDLHDLKNGKLASSHVKKLGDAVQYILYGQENKLSVPLVNAVKHRVESATGNSFIDREINAPSSNLQRVRFISDRALRDKIRSKKKSMDIPLHSLLSKGADHWSEYTDHFNIFEFGQNVYSKEIKNAEGVIEHLTAMNLPAMKAEVEQSIAAMKVRLATTQYRGFNRITSLEVAAILGKLHEYQYSGDGYGTRLKIFADSSLFNLESVDSPIYEYTPMTYTFKEMEDTASQQAKDLVDFLENFPPLGGKAVFDHYRVVMPSLFNGNNPKIDRYLLKSQQMVGVLLGERDGEQYFISYWI